MATRRGRVRDPLAPDDTDSDACSIVDEGAGGPGGLCTEESEVLPMRSPRRITAVGGATPNSPGDLRIEESDVLPMRSPAHAPISAATSRSVSSPHSMTSAEADHALSISAAAAFQATAPPTALPPPLQGPPRPLRLPNASTSIGSSSGTSVGLAEPCLLSPTAPVAGTHRPVLHCLPPAVSISAGDSASWSLSNAPTPHSLASHALQAYDEELRHKAIQNNLAKLSNPLMSASAAGVSAVGEESAAVPARGGMDARVSPLVATVHSPTKAAATIIVGTDSFGAAGPTRVFESDFDGDE